ncbi:hypothetical protein [Candidatus Paracaedibacter symbiosus]|uniref:hypothetical protein n=1 Tax=Candidatus Paracaedibacter symbiosus TaxID=244582 RepID=UPI000509F54D|nr:hypothetical protein [Candidatus Paracaedibacter symbiosus]
MLKVISFKSAVWLCLAYGSSNFLCEAQASKLVVKNNLDAPVEMIIQHDSEDALVARETPLDSPELKDVIKPGQEKTYEITKPELSYTKKFSVIGKVTLYALSDRCSNLDVDDDYLIFLNSKKGGGVVCSYRKLK